MYCRNCGTKIKDGAKFCTECGSPAVQPVAATSAMLAEAEVIIENAQEQLQAEGIAAVMQEGQRRSKAKMSPMILIALVLALMAGTAFAAYYVYTEVYIPYRAAQDAQNEAATESVEEQPAEEEFAAPKPAPSLSETLFANNFGMFTFATNVGAWQTNLEILNDGTFSGSYRDTDMVGGDGYLATMYRANYSGKFSALEEISPTVYKLRMDELVYENDQEEIVDDLLVVPAEEASGLPDAANCIVYDWYLYLPGQSVAELPENVTRHLSITGLDNLTGETLGQAILYVNYGNRSDSGDEYAVFVALNGTGEANQMAEEASPAQARHEVAGNFEFDIPAYWEGRVWVDVVSDDEVYIRTNIDTSSWYNYLVEVTRNNLETTAMIGGDVSAGLHYSGRLDDETFFGVRCVTPQLWYPSGQTLIEEMLFGLTYEQYSEFLDLATGGLVTYDGNGISENLYPAPIMKEFAESVKVRGYEVIERIY